MAYYNTDTLQDLSLTTERYDPYFSGKQTPGKLRIKEAQHRKNIQNGVAQFNDSRNPPGRQPAPPSKQNLTQVQLNPGSLHVDRAPTQGSQAQTAGLGNSKPGKAVLYVLGGVLALVGLLGVGYLIKQGKQTPPMLTPTS